MNIKQLSNIATTSPVSSCTYIVQVESEGLEIKGYFYSYEVVFEPRGRKAMPGYLVGEFKNKLTLLTGDRNGRLWKPNNEIYKTLLHRDLSTLPGRELCATCAVHFTNHIMVFSLPFDQLLQLPFSWWSTWLLVRILWYQTRRTKIYPVSLGHV